MNTFSHEDLEIMRLCLELAGKGAGWASPNPMVGSVVVRDSAIVGQGYHARCGDAHAEVNALNEAGDKSRGSTLYISLEPCSHYGKTPPCVDRVLESGVTRVVLAHEDPNPKVKGEGIRRLREAGIQVDVGCLEAEARRLNECFLKWILTKRPFVHAKYAMSLDGKIATESGDSRWVSCDASRERVHWFRALYDAILVGVGTVLCDDPMLNCRLPLGDTPWKQPLRIVVDPEGRTPLTAAIVSTAREIPTLLVLSKGVKKESELHRFGVETVVCPMHDGIIDLEVLLDILGQRKITGLLVEGGTRTLTSFWQRNLVDKYTVFIAPKLFGGRNAPSPLVGKGIERISDASPLKDIQIERFGDDVAITGYSL